MKEYNIAAFCRLLGVSADTLRYYERRKLLCAARNPENSYRTYTRQDALDVWNLYMLRSLDMGLREMAELRGQGSFEAQSAFLQGQERALEKEIQRLRKKKRRIQQLSVLYDLACGVGRPRLVESMQGHYAVYVIDGEKQDDSRGLAAMSAWVKGMPFSYIALSIPQESLAARPEIFPVRIGLGVLEENLEKAGRGLSKNAEYMPPQGKNMCFAFITENVFGLGAKDLLPLYQQMEAGKLRLAGPASGRVVCSSCRAGNPQYLIALSVPVAPL